MPVVMLPPLSSTSSNSTASAATAVAPLATLQPAPLVPVPSTAAAASNHLGNNSRWIFDIEKINFSPSRLDGITAEQELLERQSSALFINDLGLKLKL